MSGSNDNKLTHRKKQGGSKTQDEIIAETESNTYDAKKHPKTPAKPLSEEVPNLILLTLLYCFQGVPLGLAFGSLPILMKHHFTYTEIGIFTLCSYPVDSIFFKSFGRRKTWIVPMQIISGGMLMYLSSSIDHWVTQPQMIAQITLFFFVLVFIYATQDIAVDGWALTLLSDEHSSLGSTCQSVGQQIGVFLSYSFLLSMTSVEFCNQYLRTVALDEPVITVGGYLYAWGVIYVLFTLGLAFFKDEGRDDEALDQLTLKVVYQKMFAMARLPAVLRLVAFLLVTKISFIPVETSMSLKLVEKGFPDQDLAFIAILMIPFDVFFSIYGGKMSHSQHPLMTFRKGLIVKLILGFANVGFAYIMPTFKSAEEVEMKWMAGVILLSFVGSMAGNLMFVSQCAFFINISDKSIGGTYLTLLNTIANLGYMW
eukprot:CAMPEP_0114985498 /NCGR_PEP_ID=MMETSP0216-20121206/7894_1 /TAXON_ID=223996 /ORGANISM="Protocruzia adherens, Strain Boccale" /LENGTH=425 /DNA_ID=CAMNT_0002347809 /DNA_START=1 /DNA_END=1275 /DNA_ORIENTATION=-